MATYKKLHEWDVSAREAVALQKQWREKIKLQAPTGKIETIAGCDISFNKYEDTVYAGIIVLQISNGETLERAGVVTKVRFPYIPGLLSFREVPALLEAWEKLSIEPDAVVLDGQGIAHPRRMGIGAHFGLLIDRPTFGCAKSVLVGKFDDPAPERGHWSPMVDKGETVGAALRTKNKVNPVYISPGHLIDLESAIDIALRTDGGYRVPEPTRRAHLFVNELREQNAKSEKAYD